MVLQRPSDHYTRIEYAEVETADAHSDVAFDVEHADVDAAAVATVKLERKKKQTNTNIMKSVQSDSVYDKKMKLNAFCISVF